MGHDVEGGSLPKGPDWKQLCRFTSVSDWDQEGGKPISRDLWWTAKLFYGRVTDEDWGLCWLLPTVSPGGDGSIYFEWRYGFRKLTVEVREGLWDYFEKDMGFRIFSEFQGCLPEEAVAQVEAFLVKCGKDKWRA